MNTVQRCASQSNMTGNMTGSTTYRAAFVQAGSSPERIVLGGRLDAAGTGQVWHEAMALVEAIPVGTQCLLDMSEAEEFDGAGAGLVLQMTIRCEQAGSSLHITGLSEEFEYLLSLFDKQLLAGPVQQGRTPGLVEKTGQSILEIVRDLEQIIIFTGKILLALHAAVRQPRSVRWKDMLAVCESAGLHALPIIMLVGFLMGLILAFQSAIPMRRFGADIYVANLLGLSILRELGPLITAILIAGRSGSSFAAELGTMKVNEEINALTTMGLSPVHFLVLPRILAAMAVAPVLTLVFSLFSFIGGGVVVCSFGYGLPVYLDRVVANVSQVDFLGGLVKALIFSALITTIGCHRGLSGGLSADSGASAVGTSTTSSVVSALVLITFADGIIAIVYYALGI